MQAEKIIGRLGRTEGYVLALASESEGDERITGIFEETLSLEDGAAFRDMEMPKEWALLEFGPAKHQLDPAALIEAIDAHRVAPVYKVGWMGHGGFGRAVEALEEQRRHLRQAARQRHDLLRHELGEIVYPCRRCGRDLLPDGLLAHSCPTGEEQE